MDAQLIGVVDTAVKIGLGALITGLSTYFATARDFKHQINKEKMSYKVEMLTTSISGLEEYFHCLSDYISRMDGTIRSNTNPPNSRVHFKEVDDLIVDCRQVRSQSITKLQFIGERGICEVVKKAISIENEIRELVIFQNKVPTIRDKDLFSSSFRMVRDEYNSSLDSAFENLFK